MTQVLFDHAVELRLMSFEEPRLDAALRIGSGFRLLTPALGDGCAVEPGAITADVRVPAELVGLHTTRLTDLALEGDGTLTAAFNGGQRIDVRPHPQFEAWTLTVDAADGAKGLWVCTPGGW